MKSSQAAVDLIVDFEVSSEAAYNARYKPPTWPGGQSGVTIGIGYDCGYETAAQIRADWGQYLPADMVTHLAATAGLRGASASTATHSLHTVVSVPWDAAMAVFENHDMPKWEAAVTQQLQNTGLLSGDSFGALVSLAYNRGASFHLAGDRYNEMRAIAANMASKTFYAIPDDFIKMCRLWPNVPGLQRRRKAEAALFTKGLTPSASPGKPSTPSTPSAPPVSAVPAGIHHNAKWVQQSLDALGYHITIDGQYGTATVQAVKNFQIAYKLEPDGLAGEETCAKIAELIAQKGK